MLGLAHSTVNSNVKTLEKQLGVWLFMPYKRGVRPTSAGQELYEKVAPLFNTLCATEKNISEFNIHSKATIKIACSTNFVSYYLAKHISDFRLKYPRVQFQFKKILPEQSSEILNNWFDADILFSTLFVDEKDVSVINLGALTSTFFCTETFASKHEINGIEIEPELYNKTPFVAIENYHRNDNTVAIMNNQEMMFQMVMQDVGFGWCLDKFLDICHPNDKVKRFDVAGINLETYDLNCYYKKEFLSHASKAFISHIKSSLHNLVSYKTEQTPA